MTEQKSQYNRRSFLKKAAGFSAAAPFLIKSRSGVSAQGRRRNIIFIFIDDMRYDVLSCLGHPVVSTPNLDKMVKNGLLFKNTCVTTSLCSPSRATILTGQYAHTHGVLDNSTLIPEGTPTFPVELQKAGYKTGFVGKWHMGGSNDNPRPGFDRWVSFRGQGAYQLLFHLFQVV